jgi:hypothetical protein
MFQEKKNICCKRNHTNFLCLLREMEENLFFKKKPLKPATTLLHKSKARLKSVEQ